MTASLSSDNKLSHLGAVIPTTVDKGGNRYIDLSEDNHANLVDFGNSVELGLGDSILRGIYNLFCCCCCGDGTWLANIARDKLRSLNDQDVSTALPNPLKATLNESPFESRLYIGKINTIAARANLGSKKTSYRMDDKRTTLAVHKQTSVQSAPNSSIKKSVSTGNLTPPVPPTVVVPEEQQRSRSAPLPSTKDALSIIQEKTTGLSSVTDPIRAMGNAVNAVQKGTAPKFDLEAYKAWLKATKGPGCIPYGSIPENLITTYNGPRWQVKYQDTKAFERGELDVHGVLVSPDILAMFKTNATKSTVQSGQPLEQQRNKVLKK